MAEKPILFSGPMVRAILDDRKTMTRRVAAMMSEVDDVDGVPYVEDQHGDWYPLIKFSPYYVGQTLWVRETWVKWDGGLTYLADTIDKNGTENEDSKRCRLDYGVKWRPSIFMPRWASRITLRITSVNVERLQNISESDAIAEGVTPMPGLMWKPLRSDEPMREQSHRDKFQILWDNLNEKRGCGWKTNPWVWVISFERV